MKLSFLDTNIILRYLTCDDEDKATRCEHLFRRVSQGKEKIFTSTMVIAEVVWTLEKAYKVPKADIVLYVQKILNTPDLEIPEKNDLLSAIGLYELKNVDFMDAYNAAVMEANNIATVYSYDRHFDQFPPIKRIEPKKRDLSDLLVVS